MSSLRQGFADLRQRFGTVGQQAGLAKFRTPGIVFFIALALWILLGYFAPDSIWYTISKLVLTVDAVVIGIRLLPLLANRSLWSLRSRLLVVYLLIGILPIILILTLVGLSAWALTSEVAIYLARSELDRRLGMIKGGADSLHHEHGEQRYLAAGQFYGWMKDYYPGFAIYLHDANGDRSYPVNAPALNLSPEWRNADGLIYRQNRFYGWTHIKNADEEITIIAPFSRQMIATLIPNLGIINLHEPSTPARRFKPDDPNPDFKFESNNADPVPVNRLPPAKGRLDIPVRWFSSRMHQRWNAPNQQHDAVLEVETRPSAVLANLFTDSDFMRTTLMMIIIVIAIVFLLSEIVAACMGASLSMRITRAVNELYEGTRRIIYGDFQHRIPLRGQDQLGELSMSFNQMTENLERLLSVEKEKQRLQAEVEIAREVQNQLYPKTAPCGGSLHLTVHCEPARMVSGDYYDYQSLSNSHMSFAIGDVAGKGISAALLMATLQAALRAQISYSLDCENLTDLSAAQLVSQLNQQLYAHTSPEKYATFFFAIYDEQSSTLCYTNAGHLSPMLVRNGTVTALDSNGTVVGAFPFSKFGSSKIKLERGDLLVCYTDGVTEPENSYGEMFGEDRMMDLIQRHSQENDVEIIKRVVEAVRSWTGSPELYDDVTLMLARHQGSAA